MMLQPSFARGIAMHASKRQLMSRGFVMSIIAYALVASSAVLGSSRTGEPLARHDI